MAEKTELKKIIITIINDPDLSIEEIQDDTRLIGEEGLFFDSIDVLELLVEIEKKFGIKISDNNIVQDHFTTFQNFYQFILANEK